MEYSTGDLQCLNLDSTDLDRLASLADSYFSNRENEEEAFDSASDSSSDDENADEDDNLGGNFFQKVAKVKAIERKMHHGTKENIAFYLDPY